MPQQRNATYANGMGTSVKTLSQQPEATGSITGNAIVNLSIAELMHVGYAGVNRRIKAIHKGRQPYHGIPPDREWQADIEGVIGEYVVSKYFNVCWVPSYERDKDVGDVAGVQVRTTLHKNGCLIVNKGDNDYHHFVLVTGEGVVGRVWHVRGWMSGFDAKQDEFWTAKQPGRFSYFVPQSRLNPMEALNV